MVRRPGDGHHRGMTEATTPPAADGDSPFSAPPRLGSELRALRRSRSDRVIAGVLGGMGRRLGVDPLVLRIVTVVLAIFGGVGVLAYAAAWLLIPAEDDEGSVAEQALGRQDTGSPRTATVALALGLTLVVLVAGGGLVGGDWDGGVLLLLAALGFVVLLRRDDRPPAAETAPGDDPAHPPTSGIDYPGYPGYPGHGQRRGRRRRHRGRERRHLGYGACRDLCCDRIGRRRPRAARRQLVGPVPGPHRAGHRPRIRTGAGSDHGQVRPELRGLHLPTDDAGRAALGHRASRRGQRAVRLVRRPVHRRRSRDARHRPDGGRADRHRPA